MISMLPQIMMNCLLLTIIFEGVAALIIGFRDPRDFVMTVLANMLTNPVLVVSTFIIGYYFGIRVRMQVEIILEISVVFVEGLVYRNTLKYKKLNPFLVAFILNLSSYLLGFVANRIIY